MQGWITTNAAVKHCGNVSRRVQNIFIILVFIYGHELTQKEQERKHVHASFRTFSSLRVRPYYKNSTSGETKFRQQLHL